MGLTSEESALVDLTRKVAKLWVFNEKNDEKTVNDLAKDNVWSKEECQYLLEATKPFVNAFGLNY